MKTASAGRASTCGGAASSQTSVHNPATNPFNSNGQGLTQPKTTHTRAQALNHLKPDGRGSIDRRHSVDRSERPQKFTSSKPSPAVPFPDDTLDDVSPVTALPHPRTESSKSRDGSREEREEGAPQRATQVRAQIDAATNEPVPLPDTAVPHDNAALDAFEAPPPPQQQQQQSTQLAVPQTANALAIFAASAAVAVLAFYIGFLRGTAAEQLNATAVH